MTQERDLRIKQYLETAKLAHEVVSGDFPPERDDMISLFRMRDYYARAAAELFDRGDQ